MPWPPLHISKHLYLWAAAVNRYAERGAEILGFTLKPHQVELTDRLSEQNETNAICWPRRAGKTESIWAYLVGRMDLDPFTNVIFTAQTGSKARDRFFDHTRRIERTYPQEEGGPKILHGAYASMEFANGSRMWTATPVEDAARGDAASIIFIDEAQSFDPGPSYALRAGWTPILDTVPDGMVILAGTPGRARAGWFWDALEAGRRGDAGHYASVYAAEDDDDPDDEEVWQRVHPGIGTLTTLEKMRARRAELDDATWMTEYLGVWPLAAFSSAIDGEAWSLCQEPLNAPRDRFVLAMDVSPDSGRASLVAAWKTPDDVTHVALQAQRPGTAWLPAEVARILTKYPRAELVYDAIGANIEPAQVVQRNTRVAKRVHPVAWKDIEAGQAHLVKRINTHTLRHPDQPGLNNAAEAVNWKKHAEKGRAFGWAVSGGVDIGPIRGAALAGWHLEKNPEKKSVIVPNR